MGQRARRMAQNVKSFQVSAPPPAKKTADQIEKETMNNRKSAFVIRYVEFRCSA
jgi:hypothetical protein